MACERDGEASFRELSRRHVSWSLKVSNWKKEEKNLWSNWMLLPLKKKREKKERRLDFLNLDDQIGSDESSLCLVYLWCFLLQFFLGGQRGWFICSVCFCRFSALRTEIKSSHYLNLFTLRILTRWSHCSSNKKAPLFLKKTGAWDESVRHQIVQTFNNYRHILRGSCDILHHAATHRNNPMHHCQINFCIVM